MLMYLYRYLGINVEPDSVWAERIKLLKPYQVNKSNETC